MAGDDDRSSASRRALLGSVAAGLATGLSGCALPASSRGTLTRPPRRTPPWPDPPGRVADDPSSTPTTPEPNGRTYYVATDGDDADPGTADRPVATVDAALGRVSPGDRVLVRAGTYRVAGRVGPRDLDGTASAPIRVGGVPGERPVFDFAGASVGMFEVADCRHVTVHDLVVRNAPSRGLFVCEGSRDVLVRDVDVGDCGGDPDASGAGIFLLDTTDCTVSRCVSHGNYDAPTGGENADGIAVETSPGALVEDSVAYDNADDGVDLWNATGVTLRNCVAAANGWGPDGTVAGDGNGFKLGGGDRPSGDNRVERCIAYSNRVRGFDDNDATRPLTLYNCTAWNNPINFRLGCNWDFFARECVPHRLRNNLSARGNVVVHTHVDGAANSWSLDLSDPGFASTSPTNPAFLSLTADSPAVDAGVDVGLPFLGDAPDLGAIEYSTDR